MKIFNFLILFLTISNQVQANLASSAGQILVENFKCEGSSGSEVQNVLGSLNGLKATLSQINDDQKECSDVNAAIGKLPEIDSILRQVENYGVGEEIKEQENIISEALSDLAGYKKLSAEEKLLYPSEVELNNIVARARVRLIELNAANKAKGGTAQRQRYLDGIRQLDVLSQELAFSMKKNTNCFEKNPILKKQVLTGLVGIAGFFAQTPIGIGITLAGRAMQNIFDISDSSNSNLNKSFESANQSLLVSGLTCSAEKLSQQHCRLVRQKQLIEEMKNQPTCSDPLICEKLSKTQAGAEATKAFDNITKQLANSRDNSEEAVLARRMLSGFLAVENDFNSSIESLALKSKSISGSSFQKEKEAEQMKGLLRAFGNLNTQLGLSGNVGNGMGMGGGDSPTKYDITPGMNQDDKNLFLLRLIFSEKEVQQIVENVTQEIATRTKDSLSTSDLTPRERAMSSLSIILAGETQRTTLSQLKVMETINARLQSPDVFNIINENFKTISNNVKSRTLVKSSSQKIGEFIDTFYQEQIGQKNSYQEVMSIKSYLDNLPPQYVKRQSELMNIDQMKKDIDEVTQLAQQIDGADKVSADQASTLYQKMSRLLDPSLGFKDKLSKVVEGSGNYLNRELTKQNLDAASLTQIHYLQQKEFLENVYGINDLFEKSNEVNSALALSAGQIDAYGKFIGGYIGTAVNFLNGKDFEGRSLSPALIENIDLSIKNKFCIQMTSMTVIPKEVISTCQGVVLKEGGLSLSFDQTKDMSHKDRVCAYHNFKTKMQYQKNKGKYSPERPSVKADVR